MNLWLIAVIVFLILVLTVFLVWWFTKNTLYDEIKNKTFKIENKPVMIQFTGGYKLSNIVISGIGGVANLPLKVSKDIYEKNKITFNAIMNLGVVQLKYKVILTRDENINMSIVDTKGKSIASGKLIQIG